MSPIFDRSTSWIVDRPFVTIVLLLAITAVAGVGYYSPEIVQNLFSQQTEYDEFETGGEQDDDSDSAEVESLMGGDAVIVCESDSFFTAQGASAMRTVVDRLRNLDHVANVTWMDLSLIHI